MADKTTFQFGFINAERVVFRDQFQGNGSDVTFTLDGPDNATFDIGAWSAANIASNLPAHVTKTNKKPLYDSLIPISRNRISVSDLNTTTGVVTLDYAPRNGADFYVWYWYTLAAADVLSDYYHEDFVASMETELSAIPQILDTDSSNVLLLNWDEDDNTDRTLKFKVGGADRTLTLSGDAELDQDVHTGATPTHVDLILSESSYSGATYTTIQDYINFFGDSTLLSGGTIIDAGSGVATIASCTAWAKETDSDTAAGKFFDFAGGNTGTLTDMTTHYIYLDYNKTNGSASPQLVTATSLVTYGLKRDHVFIGYAYRNGAILHMHTMDEVGVGRGNKSSLHFLEEIGAHRVSGAVVSDGGSLALSVSSGVLYIGNCRHMSTINGSSWSTWYYDGNLGTPAWVETTGQSTLDNVNYNDVATGLDGLTANRYGVHWVYTDYDGTHMFIVYGQGDYLISQAISATVPASLPNIATNYGILLAKVIVQEGQTALTIYYPWTTEFSSSLATDHGNLAGLGGDDHTQYFLADGTRAMTGNIIMPDGGTIGQAAGPLLTFDDTNNLLGISTAVTIGGTLLVPHYIMHVGDEDTFFYFTTDNIQASVGNEILLYLHEGAQDYVRLGDGGDVDINLAGGVDGALFVQGSSANVGIGTQSFGASMAGGMQLANATAPTGNVADTFALYAADRGGTAGKSSMHLRCEDGTVHVLGDRVGFGTITPISRFEFRQTTVTPANELVDGLSFTNLAGDISGYFFINQFDSFIAASTAQMTFQPGTYVYFNSQDNIYMNLGDSAGAKALLIRDSGSAVVSKIDSDGNVGVRTTSFGANMAGGIQLANATAPTGNIADTFALYAFDQVGGNSCPHIRTENGAVVKLYQQAHIADAPGDTAANNATTINAILVALENNGLLASS